MPGLDFAKETIAYLKFWLGILVVTDISMIGWLITVEAARPVTMWAAITAVAAATLGT